MRVECGEVAAQHAGGSARSNRRQPVGRLLDDRIDRSVQAGIEVGIDAAVREHVREIATRDTADVAEKPPMYQPPLPSLAIALTSAMNCSSLTMGNFPARCGRPSVERGGSRPADRSHRMRRGKPVPSARRSTAVTLPCTVS